MDVEWARAIENDDVERLKLCIDLQHVDDFESQDNGFIPWNPLQYALHKNSFQCVDWLLEAGASVSTADVNGVTALMLVIQLHSEERVLDVLRYYDGSNVNAYMYPYTMLNSCVCQSFQQAAKRLVCFGANDFTFSPTWLVQFCLGREKCRQAALVLVGCRRFHRSPVLATNALDVVKLIGRHVWSLQMCVE